MKARLRETVLTIDDSACCSRLRRNFSRLRSRWTLASGARWGERVACWPDTLPCFFLSSLVLVACFLSLLCLLYFSPSCPLICSSFLFPCVCVRLPSVFPSCCSSLVSSYIVGPGQTVAEERQLLLLAHGAV